ncbi:hypothetical protein [Thiothrix sp.]|jgi:hypothetical protein|uniref:hypothetical protein n=1 Tax=Thiothrix sp. TaxID=1032 RepID=UPI00257F00AB|nr:hypothetical protein [Thiothrix sp.]
MKNLILFFALFLFLHISQAAEKNTLTVNTGNDIRDINVGDKVVNIKKMTGQIFINIASGDNSAEGFKKVSQLIEDKNLLSSIKGDGEITFRKDINKMYIHDYGTSELTEVDCYTGETNYLGTIDTENTNNSQTTNNNASKTQDSSCPNSK